MVPYGFGAQRNVLVALINIQVTPYSQMFGSGLAQVERTTYRKVENTDCSPKGSTSCPKIKRGYEVQCSAKGESF